MKLFTIAQEKRLKENGKLSAEHKVTHGVYLDFKPVVKLYCPWCHKTWLLSEIREEAAVAFGICDYGDHGIWDPRNRDFEAECFSLAMLRSSCNPLGMRILRDVGFKAQKTMSKYLAQRKRLRYLKS